jgi:hypothetical protein
MRQQPLAAAGAAATRIQLCYCCCEFVRPCKRGRYPWHVQPLLLLSGRCCCVWRHLWRLLLLLLLLCLLLLLLLLCDVPTKGRHPW